MMAGEYLRSDQGTEIERQLLNQITEVKLALERLTFRNSDTLRGMRVCETAMLQVDALWRTIYYANGS